MSYQDGKCGDEPSARTIDDAIDEADLLPF